ncbi:MAG TPA: potassium channel protein [bacterium]|nr:potassium channel protein [bacterium]HPM99176.1 potassium channel protein [bacterium]
MGILLIGTIGYWSISDQQASLFEALYMTVITITTIGYGEIIDLSQNPAGRVFTIGLAFCGIGLLTYLLSNFTAFIVEGQLQETFLKRKMEKAAKTLQDHFIICGWGLVGQHISAELRATQQAFVIIELNSQTIDRRFAREEHVVALEGDATENAVLVQAGITRAHGVFAVTDDDNNNLVISLTAKQLNPRLRIVAACKNLNNVEKIKKAGADAVISPNYVGALRMASEMLRPTVVSFLDIMLRDKDENLRVEEIDVPPHLVGSQIADFDWSRFGKTLLLALRTGDRWIYNPPRDQKLQADDRLIVMTNPEERHRLQKELQTT